MKWIWTLLILALGMNAVGQARSIAEEFMDAMDASMSKMQAGMTSAPMNGDVDHDFATMMIPHHQGAIDMAEAELRYGKDPVMRRLAQEILVDQQSEIDAVRMMASRRRQVRHQDKKVQQVAGDDGDQLLEESSQHAIVVHLVALRC